MIDIDERYDTLYEQWDIAGQPMGSFSTFIFAEYEKTLAEVKRLREVEREYNRLRENLVNITREYHENFGLISRLLKDVIAND